MVSMEHNVDAQGPSPFCCHFNQTGKPVIISGAGIPPIYRVIDIGDGEVKGKVVTMKEFLMGEELGRST